MMVAGPSQSGKSHFTKKLVLNAAKMYTVPPKKIIWCYSEWQPLYDTLKDVVEFHHGLPDLDDLKMDIEVSKLIIFNDLMQEISRQKDQMNTLFTKCSHHCNISCIYIINCQYVVLMNNPSDKLQIMNIQRQVYPRFKKHFFEAVDDAWSTDYGCIVIDVYPNTYENLRLCTCSFPDEQQ
jgi:hypothetical protein